MATTLPTRTLAPPRASLPSGQWPLGAALLFQATTCGAFWSGVAALLR